MREPPKVPEPPPQTPDQLIGGIVSLMIGIVSETVLHPVIPWTYMPGAIILMIGLGIGAAVLERQRHREGTIAYFVILAGVAIWFFQGWQNISLLAPMLYTGFYQLTRWGLRLQLE
jgi:hypothetical protein